MVITGNKLSFTAPQNGSGTSIFTYTVSDGNGGVATGNVTISIVCVDTDGDGYCASLDCNNTASTVYPGAPEVCNLIDEDCDG